MQESTRLQYLALLGIEQWLPRNAVPHAEEVADAGPAVAQAKLDALLKAPGTPDGLPAMAGNVEPPAIAGVREPAVVSSPPLSAAQAPSQHPQRTAASTASGERVGCSLLVLPGGLLLVADFVSPDAPGLSSAEHAMYLRLAAALAPGQTLPPPWDFSWPPAGVRVPGMDRPGAARDALKAVLEAQCRRGLRDIAVLGDVAGGMFMALAEQMSLAKPVCAPSLAAMLTDAERKRECWLLLAPLKREMPA
jgi:hypothetical protein